MKAREELRLVTDFGELRPGMVCEVKISSNGQSAAAVSSGLGVCRVRHRHRFMLTNPTRIDGLSAFKVNPTPSCYGNVQGVVTTLHVELRILWRVLDGLEDETAIANTRQREAVR